MNTVTVKRSDLLAKVRKNRDAHRDLFLKAQAGFKTRVLEELDEMLTLARKDKELRMFVGLTAPKDYTEEYDRAIEMLEMHQQEEITIDKVTFAQLVRNEWQWFATTTATNTAYASGGKIGTSY